MSAAVRTRRPVQEHKALPPEIYIPLVDSLYQDGRTLLVGTILVTGPAFITYWKTGEILLFYCALAIALVACARGLMMHAYNRLRSTVTSSEVARRWEHRYVAGATVTHALLGMWCYVAFTQVSDPFVDLVSFSMTIIYSAGIFGRNCANSRFVVVQILCVWAPITAALLLYGNPYHWIFAGFLTLSFLGIKFLAERLRRILLDAVTTSRFDPLTGLPNRNVLRDHMERALGEWRPDNMCAVHFVDLDQFKQVNDTLGHTRGDMLLEAVAERLKDAVRDAGVIARFGGDEFVVLQAPIKLLDQAEALAKRVLNVLGGTYDLDGYKVVVTASIGIAIAKSRIDPEEFLRNADMALYQAKSEGRGTWRWFEARMETHAQARRTLELDLRHALESKAFELYYQPLVNLKTRRILTCEALLRWPHRERGMIYPAEFIPVAEETGLIVEIANQALYEACLECQRWPGDTAVAVNLSSIQFDRSNVPALVRETLAATNFPAHRLEIEITESALLHDTRTTRADLHQLAELGVKISLDDFGTAYSSLSYLHSFPLHKVKIDQSFLRGLGDDERRVTLLRAMTRLSAQLGLHVVVEGVETEEQLELLAAEDSIDEVQGYLLGRPMPASDVRTLLYASYVAPARASSWPAPLRKDVA